MWRDMPRRAVGEIVVINTTPTTATGMIVFSLEDVHVGDQRGTRSAVIFFVKKLFQGGFGLPDFFVSRAVE